MRTGASFVVLVVAMVAVEYATRASVWCTATRHLALADGCVAAVVSDGALQPTTLLHKLRHLHRAEGVVQRLLSVLVERVQIRTNRATASARTTTPTASHQHVWTLTVAEVAGTCLQSADIDLREQRRILWDDTQRRP